MGSSSLLFPPRDLSIRRASQLALACMLCLSGAVVLFDTRFPSQAAEPLPNVTIATDKAVYRRGQPIEVTIRNNLATAIYVPAHQASCVIALYRLKAGEWMSEDTSHQAKVTALLVLAPESALIAVIGAGAPPEIEGPIVGGSTTPGVNAHDLRTLPVDPSRPLVPSRERTQGVLAPESAAGTGSDLLPLGTYRLELQVIIGSTVGRKEVARSREFLVIQ